MRASLLRLVERVAGRPGGLAIATINRCDANLQHPGSLALVLALRVGLLEASCRDRVVVTTAGREWVEREGRVGRARRATVEHVP